QLRIPGAAARRSRQGPPQVGAAARQRGRIAWNRRRAGEDHRHEEVRGLHPARRRRAEPGGGSRQGDAEQAEGIARRASGSMIPRIDFDSISFETPLYLWLLVVPGVLLVLWYLPVVLRRADVRLLLQYSDTPV